MNYSDRGSPFYDADYDPSKCLLNRLRVLQRQSMSRHSLHQAPSSFLVSTSPCHHMTVRLVNSVDQGSTAETPVSRLPQTIVSVIDHQSDTTVTHVSCVDLCHRLIATPCSWLHFLGKQVLEPWPILFRDVDVSEAFTCCASSDVATTVFSCICPEASSTYDPVEPAKSDSHNEALGDLGRRGHQDSLSRRKRGGIRSGHRRRRQSSGRGTTSRRHVLATASSCLPSCWTFDELLILRDVSNPVGTPCPAHLGYKKTLPANYRTHLLTFVAKRNL